MFTTKNIQPIIVILLAVTTIFSCKEVYEPKIQSPATGYLVVDGFISSGDSPTVITLSRTTKLVDTIETLYEHGAQVNIESDNNESFPLTEKENGNYVSAFLTLNNNEKYRLHINTSDGKEYISDFVSVQYTPPVDSITWKLDNGGVQIYANAHDDASNAKYFRWKYSETWEFHSPFLQTVYYILDPVTHLALGVYQGESNLAIYKCWKSQNSSRIILGTTEKLETDKVYLPLRYVEPQGEELSVLYYMDLKQYALSKPAYDFYQKLKKNTEQLGTIFDAQPSELEGNIHCLNNPGEVVIGYVDVTQEQEKKVFINHKDLPIPWLPHTLCSESKIENNVVNFYPQLIPTRVAELMGPSIKSYFAADPICVDCTFRGTNVKPSFWP